MLSARRFLSCIRSSTHRVVRECSGIHIVDEPERRLRAGFELLGILGDWDVEQLPQSLVDSPRSGDASTQRIDPFGARDSDELHLMLDQQASNDERAVPQPTIYLHQIYSTEPTE